MSSNNNSPVFTAKALSLFKLYRSEGGNDGFIIPEYQRGYDWEKGNIKRLFEDILNGLYARRRDPNSLAFLGTFILLEENEKEHSFNGRSLSVIDGQQRLTTLSLLACVLYEQMHISEQKIRNMPIHNKLKKWLTAEAIHKKQKLFSLICGMLSEDGIKHHPFPRIVRKIEDHRGLENKDSTYSSTISYILSEFARLFVISPDKYEGGFLSSLELPDRLSSPAFKRNIDAMFYYVDNVKAGNEDTSIFAIKLPVLDDFKKREFISFFGKLPTIQNDKNTVLSKIKDHGQLILGELRLIVFCEFLLENLIVTSVSVTNDKYGFDIFDALNTTGEPLTAVQTFKPKVVKFAEKDKGKYKGSDVEMEFKEIERFIETHDGTDAQQRASKDLVVSFALYKSGEKLSLHLEQQRSYLRNIFESYESDRKTEKERKRVFIKNLREVAIYRGKFWSNRDLSDQLSGYPDREATLACLKFLKDLKTSLSIPILCRYYFESQKKDDKAIFSEAVKALTSFVVIRRSVTGRTSGIDNDLRRIMSDGIPRIEEGKQGVKIPISVGVNNQNNFVIVDGLKSYLRTYISQKKIGVTGLASWQERVLVTDLYNSSAPLCRFMLLAASHNARPKKEDKWLLEESRESSQRNFFNYDTWTSVEVSTIEHVAPENGLQNDWDEEIYKTNLHNTLGNLTLLPQPENSVLANKCWANKVWLFKAFACETEEEIDVVIEEAKNNGFIFSKKSLLILNQGGHRPLMETIASTPNWDVELIKNRTNNLTELSYKLIAPWIGM